VTGARTRRTRSAAWSAIRNPLVVQFWLLGLDAAQGHLRQRGFIRTPSRHGSSVHTLDRLALHSRGLWLHLPDCTVHSLRPRQAFYRLPAGPRPDEARQPSDPRRARHLTRADGLHLLQPYLLEHECWIATHAGEGHRAQQLRQPLPPPVRRLIPAWTAWTADRHADTWQPGQPHDRTRMPPTFRLVTSPPA